MGGLLDCRFRLHVKTSFVVLDIRHAPKQSGWRKHEWPRGRWAACLSVGVTSCM
jgi:hypothetical protein